jgi:ZIP family zinc transporter
MMTLLIAFLLTTFAGLSTGIGAVIAFFAKGSNARLLSICTGLSAGVMLYVSFVELFPEGIALLGEAGWSERGAHALGVLAFFVGIGLIFLIDRCIPEAENPHETHAPEEYTELRDPTASTPVEAAHHLQETEKRNKSKLFRMGVFTALAITIHNFPEGLATFLTALENPRLGIPIAIAIALHNIPEGISVSVPIFYATGSRAKAFLYACLSGFAEPIGALVLWSVLALCYQSLTFVVSPLLLGLVNGGVAGIMVFISLDELLPASRTYGKGHDSLFGLVSGMAIMAISLLFL